MKPFQPKRVLRSDDEERDFVPQKNRKQPLFDDGNGKENMVVKSASKKKLPVVDLTTDKDDAPRARSRAAKPAGSPLVLLDSPPSSQLFRSDSSSLQSAPEASGESEQPLLQSCFASLTPLSPPTTQHLSQLPQMDDVARAEPSQEAPPAILEEADSNLGEPSRRMTSYYIRNFIAVVTHAYPRYTHLFTDEERDYVEKFQVLPFAAQRLFVRLYQRSRTWFKLQELTYEEIDDLKDAARTLAQSSPSYLCFVSSEAELHKDDALVRDVCAEVLKAEELRAALRKCHRTTAAGKGLSAMKVDDLLAEVADELRRGQKDLRGQRVLPGLVWRSLEGAQLLRLAPKPVKIFMRIDSLFFLAPRNRKAQNSFLLDEMGVMKYAQYEISEQLSRIFRSREEMLAWEAMNEIETKFDAAVLANKSDEALKLARMAVCWLVNCADASRDPLLLPAASASSPAESRTPKANPLKEDKGIIRIDSDSDDASAPPPSPAMTSAMRVDSSGWQQGDLRLQWELLLGADVAAHQPPLPLQAVSLDAAAARQLLQERPFLAKFHPGSALALIATAGVELLEKKRDYEAANLILRILLAGAFVPSKRGRWWDRLTLNLEQHLKQKANALVLSNAGLADTHVRSAHRQNLQKRVTRLHVPPLRWSQKPQFVSASLKSATEVTISRTLLTSVTGRKSSFIGLDGNSRTVEEVALEHYAVTGDWNGRHTENGVFATLFGLLMWKCIFAPVPDVFHHPFQSAPLDWATDSFYESRTELIEKHLGNIERGSLLSELDEAFTHQGERWPGVNWDSFSLAELKRIAQCIGAVPLAKVLRLQARDYRHMMGGLPDLLLWKSEKPYAAKLVEVKGPRDTLSPKQIVWIDQLLACGVQVEVCHVAEL